MEPFKYSTCVHIIVDTCWNPQSVLSSYLYFVGQDISMILNGANELSDLSNMLHKQQWKIMYLPQNCSQTSDVTDSDI